MRSRGRCRLSSVLSSLEHNLGLPTAEEAVAAQGGVTFNAATGGIAGADASLAGQGGVGEGGVKKVTPYFGDLKKLKEDLDSAEIRINAGMQSDCNFDQFNRDHPIASDFDDEPMSSFGYGLNGTGGDLNS